MTRMQELFTTAITGVIAQGKPSYDEEMGCLYRGPDGTKCAVGFLIDDEHFNPMYNGCGISSDNAQGMLLASHPDVTDEDIRMLVCLQNAHDFSSEEDEFLPEFLRRATKVAAQFDLEMPNEP